MGPLRPSSVPKPTNSTPKNSKTCSESPPLTETSWTTKDWPTPSPTVKPTSKFNLFTFWSQHRTPQYISFVVYFSASFLFLFSLSHLCCICRPFCYYYFNYRQKKNRTYDLRDFFLNSIKQQRSVCLSQQ